MRFPKNLLSVDDLTQDSTAHIMELASVMEHRFQEQRTLDLLKGHLLTSLFFEPSTRTRLSFETAMWRLGGGVQTVAGNVSSVEKGESLYDTAQVISRYSDIVAMRHERVGSVAEFAEGSSVPVINAGDGSGEHPTQALLDMYTILKQHKKLEGLVMGCVGDLKHGRAVRSTIKLLSRYRVHFLLISHPSLRLEPALEDLIRSNGSTCEISQDLIGHLRSLDVLYMTRVQQERFADPLEYENVKSSYTLSSENLQKAPAHMSILHPLPRVVEIARNVDEDVRAKYFDQVSSGLYVRMAVLTMMMNKKL